MMAASITKKDELDHFLREFVLDDENGGNSTKPGQTIVETLEADGVTADRYINEFWTARQRQAASLHEISYRACFKPQLPRFFIDRFTEPGDTVYDPFSGRGTTALEAAIKNRPAIANDVNPLSRILAEPRLNPPLYEDIETRLESIPKVDLAEDPDLSMFYHPDTLAEIVSLREYLLNREETGQYDRIDAWIRMIATNRLTGHSKGFFSVYSLPPNQAASRDSQVKINEKLDQKPEYRAVDERILKKTRQLLNRTSSDELAVLRTSNNRHLFLTGDARSTRTIADESIQLLVTSPPFLDIVQYANDNWLRCWFNGFDPELVARGITVSRSLEQWCSAIGEAFEEFYRIMRTGGWVAFEVGEIRKKAVLLDEYVAPLGVRAGFRCMGVVINSQSFTKTSNIWGINNNKRGTNTNRVVLFRK